MAKKKKPPELELRLFKKLIDTVPGLVMKGASTGYLSHNGHMFAFLSNEGDCGIRFSPEDLEAFMSLFGTELFKQYGKFMRGYSAVTTELLERTVELTPWLEKSYSFIQTLDPK